MTLDQLKTIMPRARKRADVWIDPINKAMAEFEINSPLRQAAFIAQIAHESGSLCHTAEIASGKAYEFRKDLGNTKLEAIAIAKRHGSTPGPWWKGHGLIMITGYDNHLACGQALGLDLLNHPELLEEPINAARSAAWFWATHGLNRLADAGRFERITRIINGGLNGFADRLAFYVAAKKVLAC